MNELKIYDIKSLETIPDYSFYLFSFLILFALLLIGFLFYIAYKKFFNKKRSSKDIAFDKLHNLNLDDTKNSAYALSKYGLFFINDERCKKLYNELKESLSNYKYKKEVNSFDKETKEQIRRFLDAIDV